jgi:ATP-binding cassette subfamily B protein
VFLFTIFSFAVLFCFDKKLIPQYRAINEYSNKASAALFDALSNISTVKILHIEKPIVTGVINRFLASKSLFRANAVLNEYKWFSGNMLVQFVGVIPVAYYIYQSLNNNEIIDAGKVSSLYLYLTSLMWIFFTFGDLYEKFAIYANRVFNASPLEEAIKNQITKPRKSILPWEFLVISNMKFSYDKNIILNNISLSFKKAERIAVIGESGSGKTTFLKVLHGMYSQAQGQIEFDNNKFETNFADIDLKTMLVPQEPEVFSSTIRENITLALDFSDEQVLYMSKIAAFFDVIEELPAGLDSVINEKGVNLSGGQKQRLALTRALLFAAQKDILLLDESTSSVDPENEELIYQNIWREFSQKTIIASIHKMNLLKFFDRIVIFENGKIADEGSFANLIERNESFRTAWVKFVTTK